MMAYLEVDDDEITHDSIIKASELSLVSQFGVRPAAEPFWAGPGGGVQTGTELQFCVYRWLTLNRGGSHSYRGRLKHLQRGTVTFCIANSVQQVHDMNTGPYLHDVLRVQSPPQPQPYKSIEVYEEASKV
jgi:hypothetical protein